MKSQYLTMLKPLRRCLVFISVGFAASDDLKSERQELRRFPDGFIFGAASAAYQVEGAWNVDGKSESIWDRDVHTIPSPISDGSTGDIAANSYYLYQRDVEMTRELGLDFYRFSLSWPRILPTGFPDVINHAGVDYYNSLIDELLSHNIQPMVTIFHWDLPQRLQDLGGWANPNSIDWYADYAKVVFELFGDKVKLWITMNEPTQICYYGYGLPLFAPRVDMKGIGEYMCSKNLLLAHARAYHIYDQEFRPSQGGNILITLSAQWYEPESEMYDEAAEISREFDLGIYAHPIYTESGDWSPIVKERIARRSAEQGFARSRLPEFTQEEIEYLRGTSDYFGLNHYSTYLVNTNETILSTYEIPSRNDDIGTNNYQPSEWITKETDRVLLNLTPTNIYDEIFRAIFQTVPWGFYKLLTHIAKSYGNPSIFVTENGLGTQDTQLDDDNRVSYYKGYLDALLDAIDDGANIAAYTAWCMMDNFEWSFGYTVRYGLYYVDYEDANRTRTPRSSAFLYKEIVRTHALDLTYDATPSVMTIDPGH